MSEKNDQFTTYLTQEDYDAFMAELNAPRPPTDAAIKIARESHRRTSKEQHRNDDAERKRH